MVPLNNVSKDAYYYWLNKIKVAACETIEASFAEMPYVVCCIVLYRKIFIAFEPHRLPLGSLWDFFIGLVVCYAIK